jgi:hypothetical protein
MSDIVRAHARAALEAGDPDRTITPELSDTIELIDSTDS